jgi:purine-nucleoside phosphorylase
MLGMSTVPEAIAAREAGIELLGLSTVTAIEGAPSRIDPGEVVATAERTASRYAPLLVELVREGAHR